MLLSCLSIGLTYADFKELRVGTILDIITEKMNINDSQEESKNKVKTRKARPNENIMGFFK